jgi:hypothetical protein
MSVMMSCVGAPPPRTPVLAAQLSKAFVNNRLQLQLHGHDVIHWEFKTAKSYPFAVAVANVIVR